MNITLVIITFLFLGLLAKAEGNEGEQKQGLSLKERFFGGKKPTPQQQKPKGSVEQTNQETTLQQPADSQQPKPADPQQPNPADSQQPTPADRQQPKPTDPQQQKPASLQQQSKPDLNRNAANSYNKDQVDNKVIAVIKEFEQANPPLPKKARIVPKAWDYRPKGVEELKRELFKMARRSLVIGREALEMVHSNADAYTLYKMINDLRVRQKAAVGGYTGVLTSAIQQHKNNLEGLQGKLQEGLMINPITGPAMQIQAYHHTRLLNKSQTQTTGLPQTDGQGGSGA